MGDVLLLKAMQCNAREKLKESLFYAQTPNARKLGARKRGASKQTLGIVVS